MARRILRFASVLWLAVCGCTPYVPETSPPAPFVQSTIGEARWQRLYSAAGLVLSLDTTRVESDDMGRHVWIRHNYDVDQQGKKPTRSPQGGIAYEPFTYRSSITLYTIACRDGRLQSRRAIFYDAAGAVVYANDLPSGPFEQPAPETVGEILVREGCRVLGRRATH